jgi:HNH endonuclease
MGTQPKEEQIDPTIWGGRADWGTQMFMYLLGSFTWFTALSLVALRWCENPWTITGSEIRFACQLPGMSAVPETTMQYFGFCLVIVVIQVLIYAIIRESAFVEFWATWLGVGVLGAIGTAFWVIATGQPTGPETSILLLSNGSAAGLLGAMLTYPYWIAKAPDRRASLMQEMAVKAEIQAAKEKANKKNESLRGRRQQRDKNTKRVIGWGLFEAFNSLDLIAEGGLVAPNAKYECPRCFSDVMAVEIIKGIESVESALKPRHSNWLSVVLAQPIEYKAEDFRVDGTLKSRAVPLIKPKSIQQSLDCSAQEAKQYIFSAVKLGLVGGFAIPCRDCLSLSTRTVGRRPMSPKLRREIMFRDSYTCQDCGRSRASDPTVELDVDHIFPVAAGGKDEADNLQTLCRDCNLGKSDSYI